MDAKNTRFNQLLLVLMVVLYALSLFSFSYANWQVDSEHKLWMYLVNAFILSIPLVLLYGGLYVLISAWREHSTFGQISQQRAKIIHWAPRVAAILIIFFVSLFSLDVFEMDAPPLELLRGFLMHSLPSIVMIVLLVLAWRRPVIGFYAFLLVGIFFLRFVILGRDLAHFLLFSGPMLLVAALFYADWRWLKPGSDPHLEGTASS